MMKGRRASATKSVLGGISGSGAKGAEELEADIEDFGPPEWRTVLNRRADLGYPDFYPSRPGFNQAEDVLTEDFVKNGFSSKTFVAVGAESFSMHGPIHNHLLNGCLDMLNKLGEEVAQKRDEGMPQIGERAFRVPVRVTYNDTKRFQFLADLANPAVPLYRLMRNPVPHGFKGVELFDAMFQPNFGPGNAGSTLPQHQRNASGSGTPTASQPNEPIPLERALWFIRVLGANEISAHRGRAQPISVPTPINAASPAAATPSSTNTTVPTPVVQLSSNDWYTQEFTTMYTSWLRIQLAQLALPSIPPKTGLPPPKAATGILGDEKARTRWMAKWEYGMKLLRELHTRYLISSRLLCAWLADSLATANLAQTGFISQLIGDYLPDMARHVTIGRQCVRSICAKLKEIWVTPVAIVAMEKVVILLKTIIRELYLANECVLLNPQTWAKYGHILEAMRLHAVEGTGRAGESEADGDARLAKIKARSLALVFHPVSTESTTSPRRQQMGDVEKLNAMKADTNMANLVKSFFDGSSAASTANVDITRFSEKVFILLNWSMGLFQLGAHRAYAVYTLLRIWNEQHERYHPNGPFIDLFTVLYKWLDTSEAAKTRYNAQAIGIVFGELTRQGTFSYGRYLKTLIAQGYSARSSPSTRSHHLHLLASMPIFVQAKDLLQQRSLALYGDNEEIRKEAEAEEARDIKAAMEEIKEYVPEIFGWKRYGRSASYSEAVSHSSIWLSSMNRHTFLQLRFWLYPAAEAHLKRRERQPPMNASTFARVLQVFTLTNGFSTTANFLIQTLRCCEDEELLDIAADSIRRYADVWTAMDRWTHIIDALMDRSSEQEKKGKLHLGLITLLSELGSSGRLTADDMEEVEASLRKHRRDIAEPAVGWVDAKESLSAVQAAISSGNIQTSVTLASRLLSRHGPFAAWSQLWWTAVIAAIQASDGTSSVINAALAHIETLDDQTRDRLDTVATKWLEELSVAQAETLLAGKASSALYTVLLNLVAHRRLRVVSVILGRLVYPIWKHVASLALSSKRFPTKHARAMGTTLILTQHFLLAVPPNKNLPPNNLRQALILRTERSRAFDINNVQTLIKHLPFLVVLDTAKNRPDRLHTQISTLLQGLADTPTFNAAAFRHLNILKDVFLSNEWSKPGMDPILETAMVEALKQIMSQSSPGSSSDLHDIASLNSGPGMSDWNWTSIVLSMRVEFKRLALRIENGDNAAEARNTLNQLVHATLDRETNADDTDLLCETFRGIEPVAAQEIVAVGLERLATLLSQMINAESRTPLVISAKAIDHLLRILSSASLASSPSTGSSSQAQISDQFVFSARHALLDLLSVALQAVERQLTPEVGSPIFVEPPKPGDLLEAVVKLLTFTLGIPILDNGLPSTPRPDFGRLASSLLRVIVALVHCHDKTIDYLVDILIFVIDSAPPASRTWVHNALMQETSSLANLSKTLPLRSSIAAALPAVSPIRRPVAIASGAPDEFGFDNVSTLDDRPWELFEQLLPAHRQAKHGEEFLASRPYKDTASIPMALFDPVIKRDLVGDTPTLEDDSPSKATTDESPTTPSADDKTPWLDYASERSLGDGLAGEPVNVKQISTSLFAGPEEATVEDDIVIHHNPPRNGTAVQDQSPRGAGSILSALSPSGSITTPNRPRRASTRLASTSRASQGTGSNRDPIMLDDDDDDDHDDEIQIRKPSKGKDKEKEAVEVDSSEAEEWEALAPANKRHKLGGKTTGGKTTRKTTGGKSVPRKATGGKSARGTGGKSVRGGKRR